MFIDLFVCISTESCNKKSMNLQFGQIYSYLKFSTSGIKSGTVDLWEKSKTDQQRWMILMTFLMHQEDKTPFIGTQEDREALFSRLQSPWMFRSWANASYFSRSHSRGVATPDPGNSVPNYILNEFHIIRDRYTKGVSCTSEGTNQISHYHGEGPSPAIEGITTESNIVIT